MKLTETRLRQIIREELSRDAAEEALRAHLGISPSGATIMSAEDQHGPGAYRVSLYDQDGFDLPPAFYRVNDDGSVELIFKARY